MSQGDADGDTVLVYPSKIDPHCEALVFVLSASDSDVSTMNLATPDAVQFTGHSAGEKTSNYSLQHWHAVHHHVHRHLAHAYHRHWRTSPRHYMSAHLPMLTAPADAC